MNLISKILLPDNILLDTESTSKKRVFERVGLLFENNQQIARSQVFDSLFAREKLGSTGLGQGVAIPHGRIKAARGVRRVRKNLHPIPFDAPDSQPVNLIFVLLVPERATDLHLQILGELAQMFSDEFRNRLLACEDAATIHQLFLTGTPRMSQVNVRQLFEDKQQRLQLSRVAGTDGADRIIDSDKINASNHGLIGHLNLIHPNWVQVLSETELDYLRNLMRKNVPACSGKSNKASRPV